MAVSFRYAVHTDLGTVRTNNEDSAFASPRLLVLADGMGGHAAGEVASAVALRVFAEVDQSGQHPLAEEFLRAGRLARRALFAMSDADPVLESMGTTLLAVGSDGDRVSVGHIGDSRVYALRDGSLYQVTNDHTHVQRLIDNGELTAERARTHPYRSMLLKSLDDQPGGPDLDIIDAQVRPGDRVLLCSDGLSDYLDPEVIGTALMAEELEHAAAALIEAALAVGTRDNVTVVVADVVADPEDAAPGDVGTGEAGTDAAGSGGDAGTVGSTSSAEGAVTVADTAVADGRAGHVLAAAPVVVGAAEDGVTLSAEAAAALRGCLPDVPFDATAPMSGAAVSTPDAPATETGRPPEQASGLLEEAAPSSARTDTDTGELLSTTVTDQPAATDPDAVPVPTGPTSSLPGILAAAAVAALVVLLYLVLG